MTTRARLVIIGAGIVGASAAYHLTKLGWHDILVLDKGSLLENDGSTSHAPGGVVGLSHSKIMTQFAQYSSGLFNSLQPFAADRNTCNPVGGLEVAISTARWQDLKRLHGEAQAFHAEAHLLSPQETHAKLPLIDPKRIVGSLFVPKSAIVAGSHVTSALQRDAAGSGGAQFVGDTEVTDIEVKAGRVVAVLTNNPSMPRVECEQVLLCTNIWAPALSEKIGVQIPLMAFEHQYAITKPLPELAQFHNHANKAHEVVYPTMRELDSFMYYRQHWDSYGIGSYWHAPRMVHPRNVGQTAMRPFTPEDFQEAWQQAQTLVPALRGAEFIKKFNGMFAFSIDGYPIMGETGVKGFWTAVASWITHSGGVGKSIAEWMTTGATEWDMRQCHINRFHEFQTTQSYVDTVCLKNYREVYEIVHPSEPMSEPRNVRLSPFQPRLQALKAENTVFAGIELANWVGENTRLLEQYEDRVPERTGWAGAFWSRIQGAEHLATRENVALFDLTGLSIIEVRGRGATKFVNYLCSNQMDKPVGQVVYTSWLTPTGGLRRDLTVARLAEDRFWMFVGEGTLPMDMAWVNQFAPTDGSVFISDVSNSLTALGLWGPNARKVLSKVTNANVSNEGFPYFTSRWIEIGPVPVFAMRISYAGELGWELHIPTDMALSVWDALWAAGREFDMPAAGLGAFDSLRLEKGYRLWGRDIYTEYNPYQAGLGWTVRLNKGDFIGREACVKAKAEPLTKKLCCMTLDHPNFAAFGYEAIYANGDCIGHVTTANYGYSIGKWIAYGYLYADHAQPGTQVDIVYFGDRFSATVSEEPLWDPKMERLKG